MQEAYENVVNRLMTIETSLRQHAQLIGAHSELATANFQRHAEMIEANTKKCKWLYDHTNNITRDIENKYTEHETKLNVHGLQGGEMVAKLATMTLQTEEKSEGDSGTEAPEARETNCMSPPLPSRVTV